MLQVFQVPYPNKKEWHQEGARDVECEYGRATDRPTWQRYSCSSPSRIQRARSERGSIEHRKGTGNLQNPNRHQQGKTRLGEQRCSGTYVIPPLVLSSEGMMGFPCSSLTGAMSNRASIRATVVKTSSSARCCPGQDLDSGNVRQFDEPMNEKCEIAGDRERTVFRNRKRC